MPAKVLEIQTSNASSTSSSFLEPKGQGQGKGRGKNGPPPGGQGAPKGGKGGGQGFQFDRVTAITWNAAAFDPRYSKTVRPGAFIRAQRRHRRDFYLLQEASRTEGSGAVKKFDDESGMSVVEASHGLAVAYNSNRWRPAGASTSHTVNPSTTTGTNKMQTCVFEEIRGPRPLRVAVINVHAGHDGPQDQQASADAISAEVHKMQVHHSHLICLSL